MAATKEKDDKAKDKTKERRKKDKKEKKEKKDKKDKKKRKKGSSNRREKDDGRHHLDRDDDVDEQAVQDERFSAALTRPQFQKPKKEESKVRLDDRFKSVLTDPRFSIQEKDKYGRKTGKSKKNRKQTARAELEEFYAVEDDNEDDKGSANVDEDSSDDSDNNNNNNNNKANRHETKARSKDGLVGQDNTNDEESDDSDDEPTDPASRIAYLTALSRGDLDFTSSSSEGDDSESSDEDSDSEVEGETAGVLDPSKKEDEEVSVTEVPSPYMAVMNMDWKHVRAVDLFAILMSFTPPGSIKKVQVYPSDFGLERMKEEAVRGPTGIWKKSRTSRVKSENSTGADTDDDSESGSSDDDDNGGDKDKVDIGRGGNDSEDESDSDVVDTGVGGIQESFVPETTAVDSGFDQEKLREYEAMKLRYYFAVVEFASASHADVAYREVDGLELEHSSAAFDMRSIDPDQLPTVVKGRKLRDESIGIPGNYKPPQFVVNALQQTTVQCTWEDGDVERETKLTAYGGSSEWAEMAERDDLRAYLASDNSSDDDDSDDGDDSGGDDDDDKNDELARKGARMRALLGLDSDIDDDDDEDQSDVEGKNGGDDDDDDDDSDASSSSSDGGFGRGSRGTFGDLNDGGEDDGDGEKQVVYIPGKKSMEEKIRQKLKGDDTNKEKEQTPWQKYLEKKKEKRRERRRAARGKSKEQDGNTARGRKTDASRSDQRIQGNALAAVTCHWQQLRLQA